ncbi:TetR/AcrR family transcriptional regulator [Clostridioides sp. ZZV14-6154]|uniref:TetR/AcrR family transcriptional regulator n=1 Tax=unclassified Clostridioides TaxID=2635829 RepID=UPI001D11BC90|nr:TetR/AcrR family transcriptional regulator [Clostridioides sp. ZZV15-6388]MCC0642944.1 TetR/AcrR family transcriptional regulator [Clostridioides sp. ZZV14-6150]MCC0660110.1 TetR/AcrR family transcriptional regulator [Clostridioides sp. ZZV14-6154]MCC0665882.1 TetR/AcrR family transcriptional regulator [Clostridioides sp. ZZV15-6597]MCC0667298.1 TetR/AcrR family transcriptional regulator [Clostridioides sp. ZZV14-6153]MCC0717206.1 TetR/AcrR family transcriptional regulator [Clostridioides s
MKGDSQLTDKQKLIITIAQRIFDQKGFQNTSILDIVKECKMSKATFYKHFETKESFICEIINYYDEKFLEIIHSINENKDIHPSEKLKRKIIAVWGNIFSRTTINTYVRENFSEVQRKTTSKLQKKSRANLLNEYKLSLFDNYGNKIENILFDLVFLLDALIHQFTYIIHIQKREINVYFIAEFTIQILDLVVENADNLNPLIEKSMFLYEQEDEAYSSLYSKSLFFKTIQDIEELIKTNTSLIENPKLLEASKKLYEEGKNQLYDSLIMDAMITYLEKEDILRPKVLLLNSIKNQLKKETL